MSTPVATIDFETRSACSLKKSGTWTYSRHATTEVLCLAFRLPYWPVGKVAVWHPGLPAVNIPPHTPPELVELFSWILLGEPVEAHNAWFERCIWKNVMMPRFGWPAVASTQWRCSAAKAAALALPRGLDDLAVALKLSVRKDAEGSKVMKKMIKPRKPRKAEVERWVKFYGADTPMPLLWWETPELFAALLAYCQQDVLTEEAVSEAMPDLSLEEQDMYALDQAINERGFCLDAEAVSSALVLIAQEEERLNQELQVLTEGAVERATQRARMLKWLAAHGVMLDDTKATTLDDMLTTSAEDEFPPWVVASGTLEGAPKRALEILRELGRSSTAKYETMRLWMDTDARVRGGLLYHGATTGRWSGSGVQPHNFKRGSIKDQQELWRCAKAGDLTWMEAHGGVMKVLSDGLRGAITASPGKALFVVDYASIEARVLLWLAQDEEALDIFRSGRDIYCEMASQIYKRPINKKDHPNERQLGKAAVLGLGYQMGAGKFVDTAKAQYGIVITEKFAQTVVDLYRSARWRVKQMWWDMHDAAMEAVRARGEVITCGKVTWQKEDHYVYCTLPSGRRLAYPFAEIHQRPTPWGEVRGAFSYMGVNPLNHQWQRQTSYGGLLVENIVQAVSRDLMAAAMARCEASGVYLPVLSVHDEVIAEAHPLLGNIKEFEALVRTSPAWADGCPIEVEGWTDTRYRK